MVSVKLVIIPGGWILIYSAMKWVVFIGPEAFACGRSVWKLLALTTARFQVGCSPLCSVFQSGRLLSGQLARCAWCSGKAAPLAKWITAAARDMADACVILQSWYFHLLVGCNRITRGSDGAEGRLKGRLSAARASSTSTLRGQKQMLVSLKCTSACSQFNVSAQSWAGRNSVRKLEKRWKRGSLKISEREMWTSEQQTEPLPQKEKKFYTVCRDQLGHS